MYICTRRARRAAMMAAVHSLTWNDVPLEGDAFDLLLGELAANKQEDIAAAGNARTPAGTGGILRKILPGLKFRIS